MRRGERKLGGERTRRGCLALATLLSLGVACGPRMEEQPSYEPYERVFPALPEGIVPAPADPMLAAAANPFPPEPEHRARGAAVFARYCVPCHGVDGRGDGPVAPSLAVAPRDLHAAAVAEMSDAALFRVIGEGSGLMLPLGHLIRPRDRWLAVLHVRALTAASAVDD